MLWKGAAAGLAISPDGLRLAFWQVEHGSDTLVLYDIRKKSQVRSWRVHDLFESDKGAWDIAFSHDGNALYARTYDEASRTPLKRFDISSDNPTIVIKNSYALAEGKGAVYSISVSGTDRSLYKIVDGVHSSLVARDFAYDSLVRGGTTQWLVSQNYRTKEITVVDTSTDTSRSIGKHDVATVLSDGKLLFVKRGEITFGDDPSCETDSRAKTVGQ